MWKIKSLQKPLVMLFLLCLLPLGAMAQSVIKGTVSDEAGEPILGASVKVVGTNTGAATDLNGKFSVSAPSNGQLEISYVGFQTLKVKINGQSNLNITLKEDGPFQAEYEALASCYSNRHNALPYRQQISDRPDHH